ncbi:tRNA pseudouridine(38-40) synthase TruA [Virgibacillus alimentarius]|uniref:tRNA pseudouridine synthase A n=1 Tax=Virgibacillus alimentarius TaxID=698769 RepID=A0ABS4S930_9BACI|nr:MULTISPECIES: tRNA pseudouridine(38-40) synthase TruA [Virgibacillus]MBP2258006.1 tRNA pseudouridine38-40 synthase [Virgibacillus alimentarius]HLR65926.1 tRNA pseudouridine(38-40) synthase TruA [Virgibacillus sp.]
MEKVKCTISYDGTDFSGFQSQPKIRTVQGELEKALMKVHKGEHIRIQASGRTDAGVHAKSQTFHFESPYEIPEHNWKKALNTLLPCDIYVHETRKVPSSFHARFDAIEKEYRYYVWNEEGTDVFKRNYFYLFKCPLNMEAIKEACKYFEGKHDFTAFSSAKATVKGSKERILYEVTCNQNGNEIEFIIRGDGFLYNMVRIMVGFLLDVGQGKRNASEVHDLFAKKDRRLVGKTVPPQGLYLWDVKYSLK